MSSLQKKDLILLDSGSTCHQFVNPDLVDHLRPATKPITIHCNAGSTSTTTMGDFGSTPVYLNKSGIANVLSLKELGAQHRILYDSWDSSGVFKVHAPSGVIELTPTEKGLHALDVAANPETVTMLINHAPDLIGSPITTISRNEEGYTKQDVAQAHSVHRFQSMIANPSP